MRATMASSSRRVKDFMARRHLPEQAGHQLRHSGYCTCQGSLAAAIMPLFAS
jgi:hypothetical protein